METLKDVLALSPQFWAVLGAAVAFLIAAIGSAKGVYIVGLASAGLVAEDSNKFVPAMILEALPSTQGIYGFVAAFMILGKLSPDLSIEKGLMLFLASLPIAIVGAFSAIYQGKVAASAVGIVAKRSSDMVKGMILALTVELFALFALLVTILMIGKV